MNAPKLKSHAVDLALKKAMKAIKSRRKAVDSGVKEKKWSNMRLSATSSKFNAKNAKNSSSGELGKSMIVSRACWRSMRARRMP